MLRRITQRNAQQPKRRGAALVEAAIVLPLLFTIILGIVEFGRGMMVGQLAVTAARTGARAAIVDGATNAAVTTTVQDFLASSTGANATDVIVDITITPDPANTTTGNEVEFSEMGDMINVVVEVPFNKVSWLNGLFLGDAKIKGHAIMRHE